MGDLTDDFSWSEFECKCGCGDAFVDVGFVRRLQNARNELGESMEVTSGIRCESHNMAVGGSSTSSHLKGLAADIACSSDGKRFKVVRALMMAGFTRIGVSKDFVHVDASNTKTKKVLWTY